MDFHSVTVDTSTQIVAGVNAMTVVKYQYEQSNCFLHSSRQPFASIIVYYGELYFNGTKDYLSTHLC